MQNALEGEGKLSEFHDTIEGPRQIRDAQDLSSCACVGSDHQDVALVPQRHVSSAAPRSAHGYCRDLWSVMKPLHVPGPTSNRPTLREFEVAS